MRARKEQRAAGAGHDSRREDRIADLISLVERTDGSAGFAAHITGTNTLDLDFTELSESDLNKGELQFGRPAALIVLLLVAARSWALRSRC